MTDEEAWQLVLENEKLVKKAVDRFAKRHPSRSFEELLSAGFIGAFQATKTWDPERGKLSTRMWHGAWWAVDKAWKSEDARPQGYIKVQPDGSRKFTKIVLLDDPRRRAHEDESGQGHHDGSGLPGLENMADPNEMPFEDVLTSRLDAELEAVPYLEEIDSWTEREQRIFYSRIFDQRSLADIGEEHGLTRERIRQVMDTLMHRLHAIRNKLGEGADDTAVKAPSPSRVEAVA